MGLTLRPRNSGVEMMLKVSMRHERRKTTQVPVNGDLRAVTVKVHRAACLREARHLRQEGNGG
jgi:hypothetical protein